MRDIFEAPVDRPPAVDALVRACMDWHFDPATGSPFWLERARHLDFDPRRDVRTADDLRRFPDVSSEWQTIPAEQLIPLGCRDGEWDVQVFESGGTTGAPKRIIDLRSRRRGVEWVSGMLDAHAGFPGQGGGHWLHLGPAGPHLVGRSVGMLARLRRGLCFYIDFDPRWVKRAIREGRGKDAARYIDHILDQALAVLETQSVTVMFATPPVLEAICARPRLYDLVRSRVRGLIWSGTSISDETLRLLEEEYFPEARVVGLYGNTMMGIACQRPRVAADTERCVFQTFHPYCLQEVVEPEHPERIVPYGSAGRVRASLLTRDLFLPNTLERDLAVRQPPARGYASDGLARVRPLPAHPESDVEGVY